MTHSADNILFKPGRRDFIKKSGLATLGLVIGIDSAAQVLNLTWSTQTGTPFEISPFILIDIHNNITIVNPRNDMGQGTIHAVPAMIAEELEVSLDQVTIIQSDGKAKYGPQTCVWTRSQSSFYM